MIFHNHCLQQGFWTENRQIVFLLAFCIVSAMYFVNLPFLRTAGGPSKMIFFFINKV